MHDTASSAGLTDEGGGFDVFRQLSLDAQRMTLRRQQEEEQWYQQQALLLEAEEKRRQMISQEEQKLADQRQR